MNQLVSYLSQNITFPSLNPNYTSYLYDGPVFSLQSLVVGLVDVLSTIPLAVFIAAMVAASLAYFVWIKIRYPFWNTQPVRHTYSWMPKVGVLNRVLPKTKFYDTTGRISTVEWSSLNNMEMDEICRLLQSHWIPSDRLFCSMQVPDLAAFGASVVSLLREKVYTTGEGETKGRLRGVVLSRQATLVCQGHSLDLLAQDYLTLTTDEHNARTLFDTHEYNTRLLKPDVQVSVFKKEVELLEGVVPFGQYECYTFYLRNLALKKFFFISTVYKLI